MPFLAQGPVQRGTRRGGLVSHLDLVPTVLDLVGAQGAHALRGESLVPALFASAEPQKTMLFAILPANGSGPLGRPPLRQVALVTPDWLYLDDREQQNRALYAWRTDPLQRRDLGPEQPQMSEVARYLVARELDSIAAACGAARTGTEKP